VRLYITVILLVILLVTAFIFGSQNNQLITLNYMIAKTEISVAAAVSLFTSIGFFLGLLAVMLFKLLKIIKPKKTK